MRYTFFFLLFLYYHFATAQEVQILDKTTLQPIGFTLVFDIDTTSSIYSNYEGVVNLSSFPTSDTLVFRHSAYQTATVSVSELKKQSFKVHLTEKVIRINEVVISAGRWQQNQRDVPNRITSITPDKVFFKNPQTTADVLRQSGEVFIQKSQQGGGSPMIRGFAANSLLIMVDGVRMNNAIFRSGNLQNIILIDPNTLEKSEVVSGPGSVIYGSDAMGGVMNFQTLTPEQTKFGTAFSRFSSANREKTGHVHLNLGNEKWKWVGAATFNDFGDLRSGKHRHPSYPEFGKRNHFISRIGDVDSIVANKNPNLQKYSGYSQINLLHKIRFTPKSDLNIDYGFYYTNSSNIPRYDRLIEETEAGRLINAEWYYGPQKWMMHTLGIDLPKEEAYDQGKIIMAYQNIEESRHSRKYRRNLLKSQIEKVNVFSLNTDFSKNINKLTFFYGSEFTFNQIGSTAYNTDMVFNERYATETRYPAGGSSYYTAATYLALQTVLTPKLIFNSGLRYNHIRLQAKGGENEYSIFSFEKLATSHGAFNGNVGLVYLPTEQLRITALTSTGFRSPNIDDIGKLFDVSETHIIVPNPHLKPEYIYNFEAGIEKTFQQKIRFGLVGFYSILQNAMVRRDFNYLGEDLVEHEGTSKKVQALVNTGRAYIIGGNVNAKADINKWISFTSSINLIKGEDLIEKTPLRHASPTFGSSSAIFQLKKLRTELDFSYNGPKTFKNMPPDELAKSHLYTPEGSLGWSTWSVYTSYQFNSSINMQINVENIFDKHYRPYSSGISAPGRDIAVALKYVF
jgi:hemoglobin/transferrin/lactoferrin receptor protein